MTKRDLHNESERKLLIRFGLAATPAEQIGLQLAQSLWWFCLLSLTRFSGR